MISFVNIELFFIFTIPLFVFAFLITTNKDSLSRVFDEKILKRLRADDGSFPLSIRNLLMIISIFLMIIALSRPVIEKGDKNVNIEGLNMMIAFDISGSMRTKDVYPNRLEFTKKKISQFLTHTPTDEIALVAFAYSSFMLAPMSSDKASLINIIEGVDDKYISMASTNFSTLGELSQEVLKSKKKKILVLFSDGGDKESLKGFEEILKDNNIVLYTILIGTQKGGVVIDENGNGLKSKDGSLAISQRNDALGEVSIKSGGAFIVATNGDEDIKSLIKNIKSTNKSNKKSTVDIKDRVELFIYPLALSLLFLLISLSSLPQKREKYHE
jgi:Ca-activated chloride channel family protein